MSARAPRAVCAPAKWLVAAMATLLTGAPMTCTPSAPRATVSDVGDADAGALDAGLDPQADAMASRPRIHFVLTPDESRARGERSQAPASPSTSSRLCLGRLQQQTSGRCT
jgi:hypothetical protein